MTASSSHLVILPTYNTGLRLRAVVESVLRHWQPVLVVVDGSTDGSERAVLELAQTEPALTVMVLPQNGGKGAAVLAGAAAACERGFTHALVMDADGQHPAASIGEFMAASQTHRDALVLGRPIFPANMPAERRHGRKLSIGLVRLELFGQGIDDPLFGFRVYPLASLLAALGSTGGGRRYDFDTEAAVRMAWAGVKPLNIPAPVEYFSRAEGGVSHFHYIRDNAMLVWMHTRLITELLLLRWPALLAHRRRWRACVGLLGFFLCCGVLGTHAATPDPLLNPEHRLAPDAPAWSDLIQAFTLKPATLATFRERRFFPFKKAPVELQGEVRITKARGLSLHYTHPEERIVILDSQGVLLRTPEGEKAPPADPRAAAANAALLHSLSFDFTALANDFELYGQRAAEDWTLLLVPRTEALRRSIGRITITGTGSSVSRIELRRSAKQAIEILITAAQPIEAFSAPDLKRFFR